MLPITFVLLCSIIEYGMILCSMIDYGIVKHGRVLLGLVLALGLGFNVVKSHLSFTNISFYLTK